MNMTLSKRGDYVMRSALSLARAFDEAGNHKIREVVADTEMPRAFASQVLADLVRAGLAASQSGRDGGYRLTRPPSEITVLEVVEAAEGPLQAERCALGEGPCRWEAVCPLHETWSKATVMLRDLLAATSLEQVAARDAAIEAGTYAAPADSHRRRQASVALSDAVQVEISVAQAHLALARSARKLGALAETAISAGDGAGEVIAGKQSPAQGRLGVDASIAPAGRGARQGATGVSRYLLAWRAFGDGGANSSHFEADLLVSPIDSERSEVRAEGTWHQDGTASTPGPAELESRAKRTLRAFLRSLASELEGPETPPGPTEPQGKSRVKADGNSREEPGGRAPGRDGRSDVKVPRAGPSREGR